eukprot:EG_transcript_37136
MPWTRSLSPNIVEQRLGSHTWGVDGAGSLTTHGPLPAPTQSLGGPPAPHWDSDHVWWPGWFLLPRRRDPAPLAPFPTYQPGPPAVPWYPSGADRPGLGGPQPWMVAPPPAAAIGPYVFPMLPFEAEVGSRTGGVPERLSLTPREAWGPVGHGGGEGV